MRTLLRLQTEEAMRAIPLGRAIVAAVFLSGVALASFATEGRYTISSVPVTITLPGEYVLSGDLTLASASQAFAIDIQSDNVTIDLCGHSINAPTDGVAKIINSNTAPVYANLIVRNESLLGGSYGVYLVGWGSLTCQALAVSSPATIGIYLGASNPSATPPVRRSPDARYGWAGLRSG